MQKVHNMLRWSSSWWLGKIHEGTEDFFTYLLWTWYFRYHPGIICAV